MILINKKIISFAIVFLLTTIIFSSCTLADSTSGNSPPNTPSVPEGPNYGETGKIYRLKTNSTDPDGDLIRYGWNFDGNFSNIFWTDYHPSGVEVFYDWSPYKPGLNNISVKAEDEHGAQSDFSEVLTVFINIPPQIPTIDGPETATTHLNSRFCAYAYDADDNPLCYMFAIGGINITDWIGPYEPGNSCYINISWPNKGTYDVKVLCKDIYNSITEWSMPITVKVTDLLTIRLPIINLGKVKVNIVNNGRFDLENVSWNVTIYRTRLLRSINIFDNGNIESLKLDKINTISTDKKIVRRLGFVKIRIKISIDELVARPYRKTIHAYGLMLGRIILVLQMPEIK